MCCGGRARLFCECCCIMGRTDACWLGAGTPSPSPAPVSSCRLGKVGIMSGEGLCVQLGNRPPIDADV